MDIERILEIKYSQYQWGITNNDYDTLVWSSKNDIPKPSLEEITGHHEDEAFQSQHKDKEAIDNRKQAIIEQLPMEKQFEALTENAMGRPDKLNQLINFISGVKDSHPKSS